MEDRLGHKKQCRQYMHQQKKNNHKTKMGNKTIIWTFQETNKQNLTVENLDKKGKNFDKKRKPEEKNWISSDISIKQKHNDKLYQSKNRWDTTK